MSVVVVSAYLISCYQTVSNADYYTIHTVFIAITTWCLEEFAPQSKQEFPEFQCFTALVGYLPILVH